MPRYRILKDENGEDVFEVDGEGFALLRNPILNKGSAFTQRERQLFKLCGFLPPTVSPLELQIERNYENYCNKPNDLEKYIFLRSLQDRNETLFYALLLKHVDEMIPIVYTPTVGLACQMYSHIFRFARGVFLHPYNIDRAVEVFQPLPFKNIEMIVVTDSEGILGIGDQGIGGMGIPVGKLSLYTGGAGINPASCLPVTLDVGTDNEQLLNDPIYLGTRQRRLRGEAYFAFIDRFVEAVQANFPNAILQWEDFSKQNAFTLLEKYRDRLPSFNDDIQGTGAVTLAGVMAAMKITGGTLAEQTFVVYGAGAGGIGVTKQIYTALRLAGLSEEEAKGRIYVLDSQGVLYEGRSGAGGYKQPFCRAAGFADGWSLASPAKVGLLDTVRNARPTVLLGLSGVKGVFTEEVVAAMAEHCPRPIVFPLSNPTNNSEAVPADLYRWTRGQAIVATGSPFPDVDFGGRVHKVGQGNNVFIFPGVGLGALAVKARSITDEMFTAAAETLAGLVSEQRLALNCVYPAMTDLRQVCLRVAVAVARQAMEQGVARRPIYPELLEETIRSRMWEPKYVKFTKASRGD
ncbi:MAG: NAD-dependent malic enzyme [Deferrisomatales bacterium]